MSSETPKTTEQAKKPKLNTEEVQALRTAMRSLTSNTEFLRTRFSAGGASPRTMETIKKIEADLRKVKSLMAKMSE